MEDIEVVAGKTRSLGDRLILTIDEGSIAFLSGSVFSADGRSVPNAKVELARIQEDGSAKEDRRASHYRNWIVQVSLVAGAGEVSCKCEAEQWRARQQGRRVDGAAVYRVALSLPAEIASTAIHSPSVTDF